MEKEIKDYLHLYLGCQCVWRVKGLDDEWRIAGVDLKVLDRVYDRQPFEFKPILRKLSDMTEEEATEMQLSGIWFRTTKERWEDIICTPENLIQLLSKHFDLFGLIESGLAIDATTLK